MTVAKFLLIATDVLAASTISPTATSGEKLLDCPLCDAPFSIDAPLVDLLLSKTARQTIEKQSPGLIKQLPPFFTGTKAPTLGSILTLRSLLGMVPPEQKVDVKALETALNALPLSNADKHARCKRFTDDGPAFKLAKGKPRLLLFKNMTGFRYTPSDLAANAAFHTLAKRNGWSLTATYKGGAMLPSVLKKFDAAIWKNVSGDVPALPRRKAFRAFFEKGGGNVGIHCLAGDLVYFWNWYSDTLVGARFIGHPSEPQFQEAKVVATIDENSCKLGLSRFGGPPLKMGTVHPIAWTRCVGKGRSFYSAIGQRPERFSDANHLKLLDQAVSWASRPSAACKAGSAK